MKVRPALIKKKEYIYHRQHIDYEYSAEKLREGWDLFFTGVKRQTIHKAAKKLSKMLGEEVVALSMQSNGQKGYAVVLARKLQGLST